MKKLFITIATFYISLNAWTNNLGETALYKTLTESLTMRVTNIKELRDAISVSSSNFTDDVIIIEKGFYNTSLDGNGPLNYFELNGRKLEIIGEGDVILSGGGINTIIYSSTNSLTLKNLIFQDGKAVQSGGAIKSLGTLKVYNCRFINNTSPTSGGAIYCKYGFLNVFNCKFENNTTYGFWYDGGGAIFSGSGSHISSCFF